MTVPWFKEEGTNIDKYVSQTIEYDGYAETLWSADEGACHVELVSDPLTRLVFDADYRCIKALVYTDARNIRITNPCGKNLQGVADCLRAQGFKDQVGEWPVGPHGVPKVVKCGLCGNSATMRPFTEDEEDWFNDGYGIFFIGWAAWVLYGDKEIEVCPKCKDKIEINAEMLLEVIEVDMDYVGQTASEMVDLLKSAYTQCAGDERAFGMWIRNNKDHRFGGISTLESMIYVRLIKEIVDTASLP